MRQPTHRVSSPRRAPRILVGLMVSLLVVAAAGLLGSGKARSAVTSVTIAVAGDICERGAASARCELTAELIEDRNPAYVLTLGDNQYENGTRGEFLNNYDQSWGRFKSKTLPAPGNHDEFGVSYYDEYFGMPQRYSVDLGDWLVHSVDSNAIADSATYLENNVQAGGDFDISFWHHPRYSSGTDHGSSTDIEPMWEAARAGQIVLYGHDHLYERGTTDGEDWFLVGTGGSEQHDDYCAAEPVPGSERCIAQEMGVLFLNLLSDGSYSFELVAPDGRVLDSGTKGGGTSPSPTPPTTNTVTLQTVSDAFVGSDSANHGNSKRLRVLNAVPGPERDTYIKFDVSGIPEGSSVTKAILQLSALGSVGDQCLTPGVGVDVHLAASNDWQEGTITGANAPGWLDPKIASADGFGGSDSVSFDVTQAVMGNGPVSFVARQPDCSDHASVADTDFISKEGGSGPQLLVTYGS
jgi:acid phosphatase type 7